MAIISGASQIARAVGTNVARESARDLAQTAFRNFARNGRNGQLLERGDLERQLERTKLRHLMNQAWDEIKKDNTKKQEDLNERMNHFARNLNKHYKRQKTRYAEEANIGNKNHIEDRWGLRNAYWSKSGLYKTGNTLYISGTGGKEGSLQEDIMSDIFLIPTRMVQHSEKYRDVEAELKKSPEIKRLVSHSLGSAVVNRINERMPDKYQTTTYATPTFSRGGKPKNPKHLSIRNKGDVISIFDNAAMTLDNSEWNPLVNHSFKNVEGQGRFEINAGTQISAGINPNQ